MLWLACSSLLLVADSPDATAVVAGDARHAVSANFSVHSNHADHDACKVALHCETWRAKLQTYWTATEQPTWGSRCEVTIHSGTASYLRAVGNGAVQTFGTSLIQFGADKQVAKRVIDFRGDSPHGLAAVPHEMTHVILADLL